MHILIIKTTSLGDVVHNFPVITDIKKHFPNALIDWVVEESFADVLALHSGINKVIPVAIRRWRKTLLSKQTWHEISAFKQQLQSIKYDVVIDTQGLLKSGLITYLSNSPNKCGYDKASAREPIASNFYHHRCTVSRELHAVTRNRQLVALALGYTLDIAALDYDIYVPANLDIQDTTVTLPSRFIMALHGTSRDSKLWPENDWIALGKQLQTQGLALVLPWGNDAELNRAKRIASQLEQAIVLPKQRIAALASIIQKAQAVVGVDTGLAHLAVALNKPVIAIYTDTNPSLTGLHGNALQGCVNLGGQHLQTSPQDVMLELEKFKIVAHA
ncbi:lipopolysaccharide heptosyltransferase 1 [mine drainage metagenome]|uniref:Lipopolysaccharide heptosyltransferase 1 n=1 Tax=mine drainage metagenome TaxID=410659 RepID=A0A1J5SRY0_9ZZZZ